RDLSQELLPLLLAFRGVPLLGMKDLLLARDLQLLQGAHDRHGAAIDTQSLAQLLKRGVGLLAEQLPESLELRRPQRRLSSTAMRLGFDGAGGAVPLQQSSDKGDTDQETLCDLVQRAFSSLDSLDDAPSEISGIGGHGSPPYQDLPSNYAPTERSA